MFTIYLFTTDIFQLFTSVFQFWVKLAEMAEKTDIPRISIFQKPAENLRLGVLLGEESCGIKIFSIEAFLTFAGLLVEIGRPARYRYSADFSKSKS